MRHVPTLAAERTSVVLANAGHTAVLTILDTDVPGKQLLHPHGVRF